MTAQPINFNAGILAHGVDVVELVRIGHMLDDHGERFLVKCFTRREVEYAQSAPRKRVERLAGRFAAKEAVMKALGTGWRHGMAWTDIETTPDTLGKPILHLSGVVAQTAQHQGIEAWLVSITHTETLALASVIAVGRGRCE